MSTLPLVWANFVSMGLFALLAVLIWFVPRHAVMSESPDQRRWRDVRIWAIVLIGIQITIYLTFR